MLFAPISDAVFGYCDVDLQPFIIVWCKVDAQSGELIFEHVDSFDLELHPVSLLLPKGIPGVFQKDGGLSFGLSCAMISDVIA